MNDAPSYTIARARDEDLDGMLDLFAEVAAEKLWIGIELPMDRIARRKNLELTIAREDSLVLIASAAGAVVGELTLIPERPGRLDLGIAIAAPWRSKGLGAALMTRGIAWARETKAYKIVLEVFPHNPKAIALYERLGFVQEGYFHHHVRRKSGEIWDSIPMGLVLDLDS